MQISFINPNMAILSTSDRTFLSLASMEAQKSTQTHRHGCVAVVNGKVRGRGCNSGRTRSNDGFIKNTCSCHAEIAALRDVWHQCCRTESTLNKQCK